MDGTTLFALLFFGLALLAVSLYFQMYLTTIIGVPFWLYMAIANVETPLLTVVFICMVLVNAYLTVILIKNG